MKKIFAIVLALTLVMSMSATAFAAEVKLDETTTSTEIEVQVKTSSTASDVAVISVDVTYEDMKWTYVTAEAGIWNPDSHTFDAGNNGIWVQDGGNTIEITNHSNRDVEVDVSAATTDNGITLTVDDNNSENNNFLANGKVNEYDEAAKMTATIEISGTPTSNSTNYTKVGSITVAITPLNSMANPYTTGN